MEVEGTRMEAVGPEALAVGSKSTSPLVSTSPHHAVTVGRGVSMASNQGVLLSTPTAAFFAAEFRVQHGN